MIYRLLKTLLSYYDSILMNYFLKLQLELISAGVGAPLACSRVVARSILNIWNPNLYVVSLAGSFNKLLAKHKNALVANPSWSFEEHSCSLLTEWRLFKHFGGLGRNVLICAVTTHCLSGALRCSAMCCKMLVFLTIFLPLSCAETAQRAAAPLRHSPGWHLQYLLQGGTVLLRDDSQEP